MPLQAQEDDSPLIRPFTSKVKARERARKRLEGECVKARERESEKEASERVCEG